MKYNTETTGSKVRRPSYLSILPLSILSMFIITKWWYALPEDGPDKLFWGFPLAFMGEGFHTSMSFQFFIVELLVDLLCYLLIWTFIRMAVQRWWPGFTIHKNIVRLMWVLACLLLFAFGIVVSISNPFFKVKRDYQWRVLTTGAVWIWQPTPRPDINNYHTQDQTTHK